MDSKLKDDGFVLIRNVVPEADLKDFKERLEREVSVPNFHDTDSFWALIEEYRIGDIIQRHLGEQAMYIGLSNALNAVRFKPHVLHDDARGRFRLVNDEVAINDLQPHSNLPRSSTDWPVHRLFIYLSDVSADRRSGGTKIKAKSHRRAELTTREGKRAFWRGRFSDIDWPMVNNVNPDARAGDAILFNLRCKHAGFFVRLKKPFSRVGMPTYVDNFLKRKLLNPKWAPFVERIVMPFPDENRLVAIVDFALPSNEADAFVCNRFLHPGNRHRREQLLQVFDQHFQTRLKNSGVSVLASPHLKSVAERSFNEWPDPANVARKFEAQHEHAAAE